MSEIRVKSTGTIKLFESDNTSHVTIASPASLSANRTITIPDADVTLGAGTTINNNADNRVITGSGTANTLEGESNLTFDGTNLDLPDNKKIRFGTGNDLEIFHDGNSIIRDGGSGSLVLRTNNLVVQNAAGNANIINAPEGASGTDFSYNGSVKLSVENSGINVNGNVKATGSDGSSSLSANATYDNIIIDNAGSSGISFLGSTDANQQIRFDDSGGNRGVISYNHSTDRLTFGTGGSDIFFLHPDGAVRSSGYVGGGTGDGWNLSKDSNQGQISIETHLTSARDMIRIVNGNGVVGRIQSNGSSTSYLTSSDYRLKENKVAISDGITRLKTLKPYRFNFKADNDKDGNPTETVDGFFAHEVSDVVPEAISGEKDGAEMQSIDQSKLVPLLVASVQELIAENETLKTRITALENA